MDSVFVRGVAAMLFAASAFRLDAAPPKKIGDWSIGASDQSCSMWRFRKPQFVFITVRSDHVVALRVHSPRMNVEEGRDYALRLRFDQRGVDVSGTGSKTSDGMTGIFVGSGADWLDELGRSAVMGLEAEGAKLDEVPLDGAAKAYAALAECVGKLPQALPGRLVASSPELAGPILYRASDYPELGREQRPTGTVAYAVAVDAAGAATGCSIDESSGSPDLDKATCQLVMERAKFRPAKNDEGKAVAGTFRSRMRWRSP